MSLFCSGRHNLRKNHILHDMYSASMGYVEFLDVLNFERQLEKRKFKCQFCKTCFDCRRFCQLCYKWNGIVTNSNRQKGIYCTTIRFCQRNLRYPKTDCMTIDFLNSSYVDEKFIKFVEEKEKVLFRIANQFRKFKMW